MKIFCIYFSPSDFPGQYVVREWTLEKSQGVVIQVANPKELYAGHDLAAARASFQSGLQCKLSKEMIGSDPVIHEVWI